jgi:hypothetical protein
MDDAIIQFWALKTSHENGRFFIILTIWAVPAYLRQQPCTNQVLLLLSFTYPPGQMPAVLINTSDLRNSCKGGAFLRFSGLKDYTFFDPIQRHTDSSGEGSEEHCGEQMHTQ